MAKGFLWFGIPAGCIFGIGFALAGVWAWRKKKSSIETIRQQSIDIGQQVVSPPVFDIQHPQPEEVD